MIEHITDLICKYNIYQKSVGENDKIKTKLGTNTSVGKIHKSMECIDMFIFITCFIFKEKSL